MAKHSQTATLGEAKATGTLPTPTEVEVVTPKKESLETKKETPKIGNEPISPDSIWRKIEE
ncbi:hypothetical protein MHLP_00980 [Candidatus Mycoplasma haematolamae str. Purdue]|uniref:Uncharacterized protein n=1 Tax=Mycoplasma haematolamae (strain Purdue) TaxID=1212765 RepID=I7CEU7_MYCHA|nr:hypothetical protein [Candidatus Mycoplasma haematolamae]AFO51776.1 hypothetical protein MHLP_00980 [Candidatus Mycoplasma haematolamae str. Purdue]